MPIFPYPRTEPREGDSRTDRVEHRRSSDQGLRSSTEEGGGDVKKELRALHARVDRIEQQVVVSPNGTDAAGDGSEEVTDILILIRDDITRLNDQLESLQERLNTFECSECGHRTQTQGHGSANCPHCGAEEAWRTLVGGVEL